MIVYFRNVLRIKGRFEQNHSIWSQLPEPLRYKGH